MTPETLFGRFLILSSMENVFSFLVAGWVYV
jgi:hypothetical protein